MNRFAPILNQLNEIQRTCLRMVCYSHGQSIQELEQAVQRSPLGPYLCRLESLGLVERDMGQSWQATWLGRGVNHWSQQLRWTEPGEGLVEPRPGENGDEVGPPCNEFRHLVTMGRCWCGRWREDHASEAPKIASEWLAYHRAFA